MDAAVVTADIPVRFAETDLMGVVHHSAYIVWFEVGRVAWMEAVGVPYAEISQMDRHLAVTGMNVSFRAAATFGDTVRIFTRLTQLRSRQISFSYEICNLATGALLVTGASDHICVDVDGRTARLPQSILERLQHGASILADDRAF